MSIRVKKDPDARSFEMSIDISAPVDDVWRALTEAEELVRAAVDGPASWWSSRATFPRTRSV